MIFLQILQAIVLAPIMLIILVIASVICGVFGGLFLELFGIHQGIGYWISIVLMLITAIGILFSALTGGDFDAPRPSRSGFLSYFIPGLLLGRLMK